MMRRVCVGRGRYEWADECVGNQNINVVGVGADEGMG